MPAPQEQADEARRLDAERQFRDAIAESDDDRALLWGLAAFAALSKAEKERDEAKRNEAAARQILGQPTLNAQTLAENVRLRKERDELREALEAFFAEYDSGHEYALCAPTDETERKMRAALTTNKAEGEGAT